MFAIRQIIEDPQDFIPIPQELRHRRTEVIFLEIEPESTIPTATQKTTLASLAGCWEGESLKREPQGDYEIRKELE